MDSTFGRDARTVLLLILFVGNLVTPALARDISALPHVENACNDACKWWMSLGQQTPNQPVKRDTSYQAIVPENFNMPSTFNPKSTDNAKRAEVPRLPPESNALKIVFPMFFHQNGPAFLGTLTFGDRRFLAAHLF